LPSNLVGSYGTCGGQGYKGPTKCCCEDQECKDKGGYSQCVPKPKKNSESDPHMTHYWDCCKPSCAWDTPDNKNLVKSCDSSGKKVVSTDVENVCDESNGSGMCTGYAKDNNQGQYPWIYEENGEKILYGYGAVPGDNKKNCGKCYEVTFKNARNIDKARIMVTNGGDSTPGNIDFAVPGGGFGQFNGCKNYSNWKNLYTDDGGPCDPDKDTSNCARYGGIKDESYCDSMFATDPEAKKACKDILWGVFGQVGCNNDAGYPSNLYIDSKKEITCPSVLKSITVKK
jgi:hypothetical protein